MEHVVRQLLSGPVCASQREAALVRVRFSNGAAKLNPPFSSSDRSIHPAHTVAAMVAVGEHPRHGQRLL